MQIFAALSVLLHDLESFAFTFRSHNFIRCTLHL